MTCLVCVDSPYSGVKPLVDEVASHVLSLSVDLELYRTFKKLHMNRESSDRMLARKFRPSDDGFQYRDHGMYASHHVHHVTSRDVPIMTVSKITNT